MKNQKRTNLQNRSLHKWFSEIESICLDVGLTTEVIVKDVEVDISSNLLKDIFRSMGKRKFGKNSTSVLTTKQLIEVQDEFIKHFSKVGLQIPPFPNQDYLQIKKYYG